VDFAEALDLAWKSERAYWPDSAILDACGIDECFVITGEATGARAFVQRDDENRLQWVAFRGTQTAADLRLDARFAHVTDLELDVQLHEGFAAGVAELMPELTEHVRPAYRTWFTGHSLGGAMAVVAALRFEARGLPVRVVTFGQPKATNAAGARRADSLLDVTRFVRGRDAVPQVPPLSWKPGGKKIGSYAHFGREVVVDDTSFMCLQGHADRPLDFSFWRNPVRVEQLEDHRMAGYLKRLEELMLASLPDVPDGDGDEDEEPAVEEDGTDDSGAEE
jgi:hypothetical protein